MRTVNISASGAASLLVQAGDGPNLIVNTDANNTLWLGDTTATAANNLPEVMPLGPGGSVGVSGDNDVYAIADPSTGKGTIQTVVIAGGLNYFLGLTQGFGKLVVNSIQSPNYVPGVSGWIIRKDGSAEFNSVSIPTGSGGTVVFFAAPTPSAVHTGDVWYDITNGLLAHVATAPGTGSWVAQQISSPAIAPQGIQPSNIALLTASLVGNLGVLNANPYFTGGDATGWVAQNGGVFSVVSGAGLPAGAPYTYAGKMTSTVHNFDVMAEQNGPFAATSGQQYQINAWVYSASGKARLGFGWANSTFTETDITVTANTWTQVSFVATANATGSATPYVGSALAGNDIYAQAILVMPQVPGGLIQAGTVTAAQIAAGTITAAQLAAGIIYAGIINGTTVNAATFTGSKFVGTNWIQEAAGTFGYSGTPALGNLIFSDAALATATSTTTDDFGNTVYAGRCTYSPNGTATPDFVVQMYNQHLNISTPAGIIHSGSTSPGNIGGGSPGIFQVVSGVNGAADTAAVIAANSANQSGAGVPTAQLTGALGLSNSVPTTINNTYLYTGSNNRPHVRVPSDSNDFLFGVNYQNGRVNTVVNSVTFTALKSLPVISGEIYNVRVVLVYSGNQAAGLPQFSFSHGGVGGSITDAVGWTEVDGANIGVWLNAAISDRNGPTLDTGGHKMVWDMTFTAPSTGNLIFSVAASIAADTWNAKAFDIYLRPLS